MVLSQSLGNEACKTDRNEKGEGCHRAEDRGRSPLHLGRRKIIRLGREAGKSRISWSRSRLPHCSSRDHGQPPIGVAAIKTRRRATRV